MPLMFELSDGVYDGYGYDQARSSGAVCRESGDLPRLVRYMQLQLRRNETFKLTVPVWNCEIHMVTGRR
jgi:hypothetical protein